MSVNFFKHPTRFSSKEEFIELIEEVGAVGYGIWWLIQEAIADNLPYTAEPILRYPLSKWAQMCGVDEKIFLEVVLLLNNLFNNPEKSHSYGAFSAKQEKKFVVIESQWILTVTGGIDFWKAKKALITGQHYEPSIGSVDDLERKWLTEMVADVYPGKKDIKTAMPIWKKIKLSSDVVVKIIGEIKEYATSQQFEAEKQIGMNVPLSAWLQLQDWLPWKEEIRQPREWSVDARNTMDKIFSVKIWPIYPRKKSKQAAFDAFLVILSDIPDKEKSSFIDMIVAKIGEGLNSRDWNQENGKYIPLLENFFLKKKYHDVFTPQDDLDNKLSDHGANVLRNLRKFFDEGTKKK